MSSRRVQKVAEAIREVVSMSILTELQDPRVRDVTVTGVEASGDLRYAKVMVSVMGDETRQKLTLRGLQNSAGFLQSKIADRIDLRYTPKLSFILDHGVKHSIAMAKILREVLPGEKSSKESEAASPEHGPIAGSPVEGSSSEGGPSEIEPRTNEDSGDAASSIAPPAGPVAPTLPPVPSPHTQP